MSHLARATATLAVLALVAPVGALAAPKKPKHTASVRTVSALRPRRLATRAVDWPSA